MPARQNIKHIVTPSEIMGEGAWIKIKRITLEEAEKLQDLTRKLDSELEPERNRLYQEYKTQNNIEGELTDEQKALAIQDSPLVDKAKEFFYGYYAQHVIAWNWVTGEFDSEGNDIPMPQPLDNPSVFSKLTDEEFSYIQSVFTKDDSKEKN